MILEVFSEWFYSAGARICPETSEMIGFVLQTSKAWRQHVNGGTEHKSSSPVCSMVSGSQHATATSEVMAYWMLDDLLLLLLQNAQKSMTLFFKNFFLQAGSYLHDNSLLDVKKQTSSCPIWGTLLQGIVASALGRHLTEYLEDTDSSRCIFICL